MLRKKYLPIIIAASLIIVGAIAITMIYHQWRSEAISISNPIINRIGKDNGQQLDLKSIIHEAEKNVIQIEGQDELNTITGSGFLYNDKGDIITNAHVIKDAEVIYVRTSNAQIYPAAVVGIGEERDIAVLRVPQLAGQTYLSVEKEKAAEIGDEVIALGSPHGFQNTVTLGIVSGNERNFSLDGFDYSNVYQISAQITHGNSGGPLINRETGKVIGINSVGTEDGTIGFSIPIHEVIEQIERWSNEAQNDQLNFSSTSDIINTNAPEQFVQDAEYLINYFFESINIRDYVNAYALLGSTLQSERSYSDFRDEYNNIVALTHTELTSEITEDNHVTTTLEVTIESKSSNEEKTKKESISFQFVTGYENDQLKIINISNSDG